MMLFLTSRSWDWQLVKFVVVFLQSQGRTRTWQDMTDFTSTWSDLHLIDHDVQAPRVATVVAVTHQCISCN